MSLQMSSYLKSMLTNMIFYERQRKTCRKPSAALIKNSSFINDRTADVTFCNKLSKSMRTALMPHINLLQQRSVQQEFTTCLQKWVSEHHHSGLVAASQLPYIHGFDFNENSRVTDRWKIKFRMVPAAENLLELHIPAFVPWDTITAPTNTTQVLCSITAASCNISNPIEQGCSFYTFTIPYDNAPLPARMIPLSIPSSEGYLCITTVGLQYELKNGKTYSHSSYTPCSVIDARYR